MKKYFTKLFILITLVLLLNACNKSSGNKNNDKQILDKNKLSSLNARIELEDRFKTLYPNYSGENICNIYFGKKDDYPNASKENGMAYDEAGTGTIMLYVIDNSLYVLSDEDIFFEDESFNGLLHFCDINRNKILNIIFNNIDTSNITNMSGMFW